MIKSVHHTGFTVKDLERSIAFYRDILGLEVIGRQGGSDAFYRAITGFPDAHLEIAFMRVPGSDHIFELIEYKSPEGTPLDVKQTSNPGSGHIAFLVDDLPKRYEELKAKGVRIQSDGLAEVTSGAFKGGYGIYILDPDDIPVELIQPPKSTEA